MRRSPARVAAFVLVVLSLSACGGGGGGSTVPVGATLAITTTSVPGGAPGAAYGPEQLEATGAEGPVTWQVVSGALPTGLDLSAGGVLSGTATAGVGSYDFTVEADDTVSTAVQPLTIVLSDLQASVTDGQMLGDNWTERALTITTAGQSGTVSFQITTNNSGGQLSNIDAQAGTATYTPGATGDVTDVIEVTDAGSSQSVALSLAIEPNPTVNHVARFGTTDVWYIESDVKRGSHAYATDLHDALVSLGLWPSTSTGPASNDFERLIEMVVRVQLLREINLIYLRESDGSAGVDGLEISFPFDEPDSGTFQAPSPGSTLSGSATRYSVMELADAVGQDAGVLGVAFVDADNDRHENDGGDDLGTLTDRVTDNFISWQGAMVLGANPITVSDEPILRALLYGDTLPGQRFQDIKDLLEYWVRAMAIVAAHEIGHSLGLLHNGNGGTLLAASISFSDANLSTSNAVPLTSEEITILQADLPGPGKSSAPLSLFGPEVEQPGGRKVAFRAEPAR